MNKNKEIKDAPADAEQNVPTAVANNEKDAVARQLSDYKDSLQRLQAEFENYKKRVDKEKVQFRQFAAAEVMKSFLPVLDSFELALKSITGSPAAVADNTKIVRGLELIYGQFYSALESQGLRPIKAIGERLDPYRHEVLMQEATADVKKDNIVAEEFQKGYILYDVVLRYSKVKVLRFAKISDDKDNINKTNLSGGN